MRQFYQKLKNQGYLPTESMKKYLDSMSESESPIAGTDDDVEFAPEKMSKKVEPAAKEVEELDLEQVNSQLSKYDQILAKKNETEKKILKLQVEIQKLENDISSKNTKLSDVEEDIETYKKNNELIIKRHENSVFIDYDIWSFIEIMFNFSYKETESLLLAWLSKRYNINVERCNPINTRF